MNHLDGRLCSLEPAHPKPCIFTLSPVVESPAQPSPAGATVAPWTLDADGGNCDDLLRDSAGRDLAGITYAGHLTTKECEQLHDLIEAAPDLREALAIILTHADDPDDDGEHWPEDRARAIAALTKAVRP